MNDRRLAQEQRVKEYMIEYGSITIIDAWQKLGVFSLSSRISQLKKSGFPISKGWYTLTNRFGEPIKIRRYFYDPNND